MLFTEAYEQYLLYLEVKLKKQSRRTLIDKFHYHILPYWKDFNIFEISTNDYIKWQYEIEKEEFAYTYKTNLHYCMSGFFKYCCAFHGLKQNIASIVGNFKKDLTANIKHNIYTYKEFKKFIKYVDIPMYREFFIFMYFTGTRPGEAMALKFSDLNRCVISINKTIDEHIDPITKKREISTPKTTSSYRSVLIDKKLCKSLLKLKKSYIEKYKNVDFDYYIFGGVKPLAPTSINRHKLKACEKANLRPIKLHEFRHSHASLLFKKGIVVHDISKRLGHSSISMTLNTYIHSDKQQEKRVIKTLSILRLFL